MSSCGCRPLLVRLCERHALHAAPEHVCRIALQSVLVPGWLTLSCCPIIDYTPGEALQTAINDCISEVSLLRQRLQVRGSALV